MFKYLENENGQRIVYVSVFVGSLLIAAWSRFIDPVINPDGVKYLLAAEAFLRGDYAAGFDAYKWPVYSLTIALITKVTQLPTEYSALIFNAVMRGVAGLAFIRLTIMLGANKKQLILGLLIYLLYPGLNEVQSMVIRDFAYLGFFSWAAVFFIQHMTNPARKHLWRFIIMAAAASAYRIEGAVFIVGLLLLLYQTRSIRYGWQRHSYLVAMIMLPLMIYGVLIWVFDGEIGNAWNVFTTMFENMDKDLHVYIATLDSESWAAVLGNASYIILFFTPFVRLLFNLIEVVTIGYTLALIAGWFVRPLIKINNDACDQIIKGWRWIVWINILVLVGFVLIKQIVTDRYPLSLAFMLMLFVPFALTALYEWAQNRSRSAFRATTIIIGVLFFANSVEGLDRFGSKGHIKQAGLWIQERAGNTKKSSIYCNDRILHYYAGVEEAKEDAYYSSRTVNKLVLSSRWTKLNFLAINLSKNNKPGFYRLFRYRIGMEPDKIFENSYGDKVLVYDLRKTPGVNY